MLPDMEEERWLVYDYGWKMIALKGEGYDRKRILFAVACCRHVEHLGQGELERWALDVLERLADGEATEADRERVVARLREVHADTNSIHTMKTGCVHAAYELGALMAAVLASMAFAESDPSTRPEQVRDKEFYGFYGRSEYEWQTRLFNDLFGNPFRYPTIDPAWLDWQGGAVRSIARSIYEGCSFERMPVLGDALEEAGCTDSALIEHCRGDDPHARGCWVLDLILGKT